MEYRQVVREIHGPARRQYARRRTVVKGYNDLFQADLVEMQEFAKENKGYRYILTVIDAYSKYLWALPVQSKQASEVTKAMKEVLRERVPKNLQTDQGKEFYNSEFKRLMAEHKINHYSTYGNVKAAMAERVNRTLKTIMWEQFSLNGNHKWIDMLPDLVAEYNGRCHRTTGMAPQKVTPKTQLDVYRRLKQTAPVHFKVGDQVRISKFKRVFEKGYTPNWSYEIFEVVKVQRTNPTTYLIKDASGETLLGGFYREELKKVRYPNVYLIEKILRKKGNKVRVKWRGLSSAHNSWIKASSVIDK